MSLLHIRPETPIGYRFLGSVDKDEIIALFRYGQELARKTLKDITYIW